MAVKILSRFDPYSGQREDYHVLDQRFFDPSEIHPDEEGLARIVSQFAPVGATPFIITHCYDTNEDQTKGKFRRILVNYISLGRGKTAVSARVETVRAARRAKESETPKY